MKLVLHKIMNSCHCEFYGSPGRDIFLKREFKDDGTHGHL